MSGNLKYVHYIPDVSKLGKTFFNRYDNLTYHEQYYGDLVIKDGRATHILLDHL